MDSIKQLVIDMYVCKPPDDGEAFDKRELLEIESIGRAWYRAAVCVREFALNPFVHDSNTPIKSNGELKTIVVVPFERLLQKYLLSKIVDMERFTVCYDFDERAVIEELLRDPVEGFSKVFGLYLKLDRDLCMQGGAGASAPNRLHMWESVAQFVQSRLESQGEDWDSYA